METEITASILCITYNHEKYISQAIEGFLSQETDFPIEILIADDASTDRNQEIIREYADRYPDLIRPILREQNLGPGHNWLDAFRKCRGKYVALCEGDDYWTDRYKLKKQVDFLEADKHFAICHHNMEVIYDDPAKKTHHSNPDDQKRIADMDDLARGNFIYTASCVFRNGLIDEFPGWYAESPVGDYALHMMNALKGKIGYLPEVMGVYRVHSGGTWENRSQVYRSEQWVKLLDMMISSFTPPTKGKLMRSQNEMCEYLVGEFPSDKAKRVHYSGKIVENEAYLMRAPAGPDEGSSRPRVSLVVPLFDNPALAERCLQSIYRETPYEMFELILIRNSSGSLIDNVIHGFKEQYDNIVVLSNVENIGLAGVCNQGSKLSDTEFILFMDQRVEVTRGWLEAMLREMGSDPRIGVVGALSLFRHTKLIQSAGIRVATFEGELCAYSRHKLKVADVDDVPVKSEDYQAVGGACMLVRREVIRRIGPFDERYLNDFYSVDFCLAAGKADYRVRFCAPAVVCLSSSIRNDSRAKDDGDMKIFNRKWLGEVKSEVNDEVFAREFMNVRLREYLVKNPGSGQARKQLAERNSKNGEAKAFIEFLDGEADWIELLAADTEAAETPIPGTTDVDRENGATYPGKQVSIIVPVFNKVGYTRNCLETLFRNTDQPNLEIIVVDNASSDGTAGYLAGLGEKIHVITNPVNLGFSRACNQGARMSSGKYLVFLNNDTEPMRGWLNELLGVIENEENVGIVGSKLLYPDGTLQHVGVAIDRNKLPYHIFRGLRSDLAFVNKKRDYQAVTAACMLIQRELFFEVGCFDEKYVNGFEDVDLCLKVGWKKKRVVYNPASVLIHHEGQSEGRYEKMDSNEKLLLDTWSGRIRQDDYLIHIRNGEELMEQGFTTEAKKAFEQALTRLPDSTDIIDKKKAQVERSYLEAQTLIEEQKYKEATRVLEKALEDAPGDSACLNDLAVLYAMEGDYNSSIDALERLVKKEPDNLMAQKNLANIYVKANRAEDGLKLYLQILKTDVGNIPTLAIVAKLCLSLNLNNDAVHFFNSVLELDPSNEEASRYLSALAKVQAPPVSAFQDAGNDKTAQAGGSSGSFEQVECRFCGSRDVIPFRKSSDIVKCASCGTVYVRTRTTQEAVRTMYPTKVEGESSLTLPKTKEEILKSGLRRDYLMEEITSRAKDKGIFLDIGCGWGALLDNARSRGFKPKGIEVTRQAAEFAAGSLGLDVASSEFLDTRFERNSISVVSMVHVLNRIPDPKESIQKVLDVLKADGLFAGVVPNIESFCSAVLKDKWEWLQPLYHHVHYSPSTLKKHLETAGFIVEKLDTAAGDYGRAAVERLIGETYHPATPGELHELAMTVEKEGFGEEIRFYARKPESNPQRREPASLNKAAVTREKNAESFGEVLELMKASVEESMEPSVTLSVVVACASGRLPGLSYLRSLYDDISVHGKCEMILACSGASAGDRGRWKDIQKSMADIRIVACPEGASFAEACNLGAAGAQGKYLSFVDAGLQPEHGWFAHGLSRLEEDANIAVVGGKLLSKDRKIRGCWVEFEKGVDPLFEVLPVNKFSGTDADDPRVNIPMRVRVVAGHSLFVRRDFFDRAGGFADGDGILFEQTDLCLKADKAGMTVFYEPACRAVYCGEVGPQEEQRKEELVSLYREWGDKMREFGVPVTEGAGTGDATAAADGQNAQELYNEAQALIVKGDHAGALKVLNEVVSIFPGHVDAHNDLAVLHHQNGDAESALTHLERCVEIEPNDLVATKNLAILYSTLGRFEEALSVFQRLLQNDPRDVQLLLSVADICVKLEKLDDAKVIFGRILTLDIDEQLREKILSVVAEIDGRVYSRLKESPAGIGINSSRETVNAPRILTRSDKTVSIVIPVFNKVKFTERCLQSIVDKVRYPHYEVIVVDNASTDETQSFMTALSSGRKKIRYMRNEENLGFVDGCNLGAENASGDYILLLNNDTVVNDNWLEALVDFAEKTPDCGAVGSKLIYPDGRLQEAGGITFSDANGWNYGRGMAPNDPKFNFVREVDYISGASIMVRKDLWKRVGGLDRRYAPAYYEDADLCFAIRSIGYKVYFEPRSTLFHFEGVTSGTNLQEGFKKYQVANRPKFMEKWKNELVNQHDNSPFQVEKASSRGIAGRVLVVDPMLPMYDRAAGSLHLFNILKIFRSMNFHITYIATNWALYPKYRPVLEQMGIETYAGDPDAMLHFGYNVKYPKIDYQSLFKAREFDFALIDFWYQAEYYLPLIRKYSPQTKIIIDTEDVHFVREIREAEVKEDPKLKRTALAKKKRELAIYKQADHIWVVTEEDRKALRNEKVGVPVEIRPVVHDFPAMRNGFSEREGILFVGNFNHTPNFDALSYFIKDVFPEVVKSIPGVKLYVVGNDPRNQVAQFTSENVIGVGYVENLADYYERSRVAVAPLRYGAGLKGKIVESLSFGVPVVTTSIGVEGTGLRDGESIFVADDPSGMATKIVEAYFNEATWRALSSNGRAKMEATWSFEAGKKQLMAILPPVSQKKEPADGKLTSIVILTFNQLDYTKITIDSIRRHTKRPYEIIVVDNASSDGTAEYLKAQKDIRSIFNEDNLGFPAGCNQGMEIARGDYVLLLNNDVIVTDHWLEGLVECAASSPTIGIVGPMSNRISGYQLETGASYKKVSQVQEFAAKYRRKNHRKWLESPRVAGFCMLIKKELLGKIGGLDIAYGLGNCEDDDYCVRARLAGYHVAIAGDVFIHHFGSRSFGKDGLERYKEFIKVNEGIFAEKWGITPLDWWREGKKITKKSDLFLPIITGDPVELPVAG